MFHLLLPGDIGGYYNEFVVYIFLYFIILINLEVNRADYGR